LSERLLKSGDSRLKAGHPCRPHPCMEKYISQNPLAKHMDCFEERYGIEEDAKVKAFHRSRRMFCVRDGKLFIADPNVDYSHAVWLEKLGWITEHDDSIIDKIPRGIVNAEGNICFYTGYAFRINKQIEDKFFKKLPELVDRLTIKPTAKVFGGLIKQPLTGAWKPRRSYGDVRGLLKRANLWK